ncbi:MAG: hypothetical protein J7K65_07945 [Planctomycetes bacterium]|nr:hypothetical protein [Planctomycetota bacterium]
MQASPDTDKWNPWCGCPQMPNPEDRISRYGGESGSIGLGLVQASPD